jgi:preprotein translocase subunit YajC
VVNIADIYSNSKPCGGLQSVNRIVSVPRDPQGQFANNHEELSMFVTPAFAQTAGGAGGGLVQILPFVLIFAIMYFLLIRPQQKKAKEHRAMVSELKKGDQVVTQGGLIGKVVKVKEANELEVEIATGVKVRVVQSTVTQVLNKTEPAK